MKKVSLLFFNLFLIFNSIKAYADIYIPEEEIIEEKINEENVAGNDVLLSLMIVGILVVVVVTLAILLLKGKGKKVYGK